MSARSDLRGLARHTGYRRLLAVRLVSQTGDGAFQAGLATLFFFAPERLATAADVATAFAVLLLPFTLVGPWAGILLDRWRRRQVLLLGNALRVVLTVVLAALMIRLGPGPAVYVLSLVTLGVNRFLLSALSAGLPRVVPRAELVMANAVTPTLGTIAAAAGGAVGLAVGLVTPAGAWHDGLVLAIGATLFAAASALALRLGRDQLGPEPDASRPALLSAASRVWRELVDGARHLVARRTPAVALTVMALHRFVFGVMFLASILLSRNVLSDPSDAAAGLRTFATVAAVMGVGFALAVVVTPFATQRLALQSWIGVCLTIGAAAQAVLLVHVSRPTVLVAAFLLGLASQGAKIAVDTIVQRDTADEFRGRAFATYDVLYNAAFVGAAALAALALPDSGHSPAVIVGLAVVYLLAAAWLRTTPRTPSAAS